MSACHGSLRTLRGIWSEYWEQHKVTEPAGGKLISRLCEV